MENIKNIKQFVDKKLAVFLAVFVGIGVVLGLTFVLDEKNKDVIVAEVAERKIYLDDYENELKNEKHLLNYQNKDVKGLENKVLESLIEQKIVEIYAEQNSINVSEEEVKSRYESAVESVGAEEEYLEKIKKIRDFDKKDILSEINYELLKNKVEENLDMGFEVWLEEQKKNLTINKYEIN